METIRYRSLLKLMKGITISLVVVLALASCSQPSEENNAYQQGEEMELNQALEDTLRADSLVLDIQEEDSLVDSAEAQSIEKVEKPSSKKVRKPRISYTRYYEFPGDANFNGKPMTQQIEMSKKVYDNSTDTLRKLAIDHYKSYDYYFPKAIADNFDEGISTEMVMYPKKLIFRFELFEDEFAAKPYLIEEVTIRRNEAGEPYAE